MRKILKKSSQKLFVKKIRDKGAITEKQIAQNTCTQVINSSTNVSKICRLH